MKRRSRRFANSSRLPPEPDTRALAKIAHSSTWQFPDVDSARALGTDEVTLRIVKGGVLYPFQTIFLGHPLPVVSNSLLASNSAEPANEKDANPPFVAIEGTGVLLNPIMNTAERATLLALVQVTQRTDESAILRYLEVGELANVLNSTTQSYKDLSALAE